jgi:hypothetical protein
VSDAMDQQPLVQLLPGGAEGYPAGPGKFERFERRDTWWGLCLKCRRRTRGVEVWTVDGWTYRNPTCAFCWLRYRWSGDRWTGLQVMRGGAA